ncbi:MAG: cysteine desulfurase family protein [Candidatus Acetothermia bacterium]|nr:cysteine desulfurase family protein [Candidatus Acetothermia bacterium]
MEQKQIYLDNAASTQVAPEVVEAMLPYFTEHCAVASSQFSHTPGIMVKEALDRARAVIAARIGAKPEEFIFTSGGTEASNLAIKGAAYANRKKGNHIITSKIEQLSVLQPCRSLEKEGFSVTYLNVDREGFVDPDELKRAIRPETILVTIQTVNQEVGTIQNIKELGRICRERGVLFHTDAELALGWLPFDVEEANIDLASFSGHKLHGPKGIGGLFVREGVKLKRLLDGGYNEFELRAGTENVPGAVGFAKAVELFKPEDSQYVQELRDYLIEGLLQIEDAELNGPRGERRHPGNVNISFAFAEGESIVLHLDMKGIAVITGSACFSRALEPSHVLLAMGYSHERAHSSIRYTLSRYNTREELDRTVEATREVVEQLRRISPLKQERRRGGR